MEIRCTCGGKLRQTTKELFDVPICAWECEECGEIVYDFSGKGESCASCPSASTCILK